MNSLLIWRNVDFTLYDYKIDLIHLEYWTVKIC